MRAPTKKRAEMAQNSINGRRADRTTTVHCKQGPRVSSGLAGEGRKGLYRDYIRFGLYSDYMRFGLYRDYISFGLCGGQRAGKGYMEVSPQ